MEREAPRSMEFGLGSLHVASSNDPKFMYLCSVLCLIYYIDSLCSGGFADATADMCWFGVWWGHGTDVPWTGCAGPSSGSNGSVRV
jgi:hypothetical protein